jgi:hypothetical protein
MALFIAQTDGTTTFDVGQAEVDVTAISTVDTGIGFTEIPTTDLEGVTCVQVTYTQTQSGPTCDRLNSLVNDVGYTPPPHIVIFAVDDSFVLNDGTPLKGNGVAIPVGDALNPFTDHVCTLYDITLCGGQGMWVDKEGGGTTIITTEVMLYHELSHCFHFVTGTTASTAAEEEKNAEIDENDMRDVSGLDHRNVDSHNGGCGGGPPPSCCIVASLATGSTQSDEVNQLRRFREDVLRGSDIGDDFFQHLHFRYYAFSPEVCRLMGRDHALAAIIRRWFVLPLLASLEFLHEYVERHECGITSWLQEQKARADRADVYDARSVQALRTHLRQVRRGDVSAVLVTLSREGVGVESAKELFAHISAAVARDEFISWALLEPIELWIACVSRSTRQQDDEIRRRVARWLGTMPITPLWRNLSSLQAEQELAHLGRFMFDPQSKRRFARCLAARHPKHDRIARRWSQS